MPFNTINTVKITYAIQGIKILITLLNILLEGNNILYIDNIYK